MFVYPLFRPSHCPTDDIQQSPTSFVYIPSPPMGENHINIDVSILVVIFICNFQSCEV